MIFCHIKICNYETYDLEYGCEIKLDRAQKKRAVSGDKKKRGGAVRPAPISNIFIRAGEKEREHLDHRGADNEEVNKRNGTRKCSSTSQIPGFNL